MHKLKPKPLPMAGNNNNFPRANLDHDQRVFIMKLFIIILALLISACATQSAYRAAQADGTGYQDFALADNHYRVQFKVQGQARAVAKKYALMRAAELTLAQGYDWFVVEQQTIRTRNEPDPFATEAAPRVSRRCGLLSCRTQVQTAEPLLATQGDIETLAIIEIRMGRGIRPEHKSYDAQEIWQSPTP